MPWFDNKDIGHVLTIAQKNHSRSEKNTLNVMWRQHNHAFKNNEYFLQEPSIYKYYTTYIYPLDDAKTNGLDPL